MHGEMQAIDTLRAAMLALSKLNFAVWEEIGGICSHHHGVLVHNHEADAVGNAGLHRLANTGADLHCANILLPENELTCWTIG